MNKTPKISRLYNVLVYIFLYAPDPGFDYLLCLTIPKIARYGQGLHYIGMRICCIMMPSFQLLVQP